MALPSLASTADLFARSVSSGDATLENTMLAVASASVRRAAGSPILRTVSVVGLTGWASDQWLDLPGAPVVSVATVTVDGIAVTDHRLDGARLWRRTGWGTDDGPAQVAVTVTHGLVTVTEDIVDLVCSLAAAGIAAAAEGYASHGGVVAEKIDDYSVQYAAGADAVASVMDLPRGTRLMLRTRFGGGAGTVTYR